MYLDDILIASDNEVEHRVHLTELFERLQAQGLVINNSKCVFGRSSIEFLGHEINGRGVIPLPGKVKVIQEFNRPVNNKGLQEFLGMVNFYDRFLSAAARVMKSLYAALTGQTKKLQEVVWSEAMIEAFARTKDSGAPPLFCAPLVVPTRSQTHRQEYLQTPLTWRLAPGWNSASKVYGPPLILQQAVEFSRAQLQHIRS